MSRIILIIICCVYAHCTFGQQPSIQWKVAPEFGAAEKIKLKISLLSNKDTLFLWDWDAFSIETSYREKNYSIRPSDALNSILKRIKHSQVIIENENFHKRFFSNVVLFDGETIYPKCVFKLEPSYDTITLVAGKNTSMETSYYDVNRLKIAVSDSVVRIHYLFHPAKEQKRASFKPILFTSDWFSLQKH